MYKRRWVWLSELIVVMNEGIISESINTWKRSKDGQVKIDSVGEVNIEKDKLTIKTSCGLEGPTYPLIKPLSQILHLLVELRNMDPKGPRCVFLLLWFPCSINLTLSSLYACIWWCVHHKFRPINTCKLVWESSIYRYITWIEAYVTLLNVVKTDKLKESTVILYTIFIYSICRWSSRQVYVHVYARCQLQLFILIYICTNVIRTSKLSSWN